MAILPLLAPPFAPHLPLFFALSHFRLTLTSPSFRVTAYDPPRPGRLAPSPARTPVWLRRSGSPHRHHEGRAREIEIWTSPDMTQEGRGGWGGVEERGGGGAHAAPPGLFGVFDGFAAGRFVDTAALAKRRRGLAWAPYAKWRMHDGGGMSAQPMGRDVSGSKGSACEAGENPVGAAPEKSGVGAESMSAHEECYWCCTDGSDGGTCPQARTCDDGACGAGVRALCNWRDWWSVSELGGAWAWRAQRARGPIGTATSMSLPWIFYLLRVEWDRGSWQLLWSVQEAVAKRRVGSGPRKLSPPDEYGGSTGFDPSDTLDSQAALRHGAGLSVFQFSAFVARPIQWVVDKFATDPTNSLLFIEKFFGHNDNREMTLDGLYADQNSSSSRFKALHHHLDRLLKLARPKSTTIDSQLMVFKILATVITRYPGVRRQLQTHKDLKKASISHVAANSFFSFTAFRTDVRGPPFLRDVERDHSAARPR
ncbi:hypothetical protein B0H14DRAFT_2593528 [Mycena olivaceomarginata]|nr:hypothetical protein B0H14DRAFT_2593528 [Mycena olivaceomarginata]